MIGEIVSFSYILENESEITKLATEKFQVHKNFCKYLKSYCKLTNFSQRFKVENRLYDHFYRIVDKKKKFYLVSKIINKRGIKAEQKNFLEYEIQILRNLRCSLLPTLKKIYEDENYFYMTF